MSINDVDQTLIQKEEPKEISNSPEADIQKPIAEDLEPKAVADMLGVEYKDISKYQDDLKILINYAKSLSEGDTLEELKWTIRELEDKIGTAPFLEDKVKYFARYAYLVMESKKNKEELEKFEKEGNMSTDEQYQGGSQVGSYTEQIEHAKISDVHGKKVFIVGEDGNQITPTEPTDSQLTEFIIQLRAMMMSLSNPPWLDKSANAIRNQVQSGTVTTVTTVTNLTNAGSWPATQLSFTASQNTWANMCRSLIT